MYDLFPSEQGWLTMFFCLIGEHTVDSRALLTGLFIYHNSCMPFLSIHKYFLEHFDLAKVRDLTCCRVSTTIELLTTENLRLTITKYELLHIFMVKEVYTLFNSCTFALASRLVPGLPQQLPPLSDGRGGQHTPADSNHRGPPRARAG